MTVHAIRPRRAPDHPALYAALRAVYNRYDGRWRRHTYCDERCEVAMWSAHRVA